jgi:hypothetical protein
VARSGPIFVVGFQRSGTTLLQSILGSHPRIAAPPETYFLMRIVELQDYYGDLHDDERLRRVLHETLNPPVPLLAQSGFDEAKLFDAARATDRSYRALIDTVLSDFAARHGKARWSEKSPGQLAGRLLHLFPDGQAIHIVRDPRDVIASSLSTPWRRTGLRDEVEAWRTFTLANARSGMEVGPDRFLQVRYEDLTNDPSAVVRLVCSFLQEEFSDDMLDPERRRPTLSPVALPWQSSVLQPITPAQPAWHRLTRPRRMRLVAMLDREIEALGYPRPRRRGVLAGRLLNAAASPLRLAVVVRRWRARRFRDPEQRYREVQRYLTEAAAAVAAAPTGDIPSRRPA